MYHDKIRPDDKSIELVFGTACHETIQEWLDKHYNGSAISATVWDYETRFKEVLIETFRKEVVEEDGKKKFPCELDTLMEYYQDGVAILKAIVERRNTLFPKGANELLGVEIALNVDLTANLRFVAFLDIVLRNKKTGKILILDLKTSKKGWFKNYQKKDPKKLNQLLFYKKFYGQALGVRPEDIDVQFMILKRKHNAQEPWWGERIEVFSPPQDARAVENAIQSLQSFISGSFTDDGQVRVDALRPTPSNDACKFCVFRTRKDLCPEGISNDA